MSHKTSEFEPAIRRLERQAAELIDEDTDLLTVVRGFDFNEVEVYETGEAEWNARYGYEPMVRAFYCRNSPASPPRSFTSTSPTPSMRTRSASIPTSSLRARLSRSHRVR